MSSKLLFSVTKKDLIRQTFCAATKGGQHGNATQNGVRLIHKASGAVGEGRDSRDQYRNERIALKHLSETTEFKLWHRSETSRLMGQYTPETEEEIYARVDAMIQAGVKDGSILIEDLA
jgi:protein subunit release factor A